MICSKTVLFAFVALILTLMTVAQAAQSTISHNAAVRRHASLIQDRPARRSIAVAQGKMIPQRRQTAEQIAQAAALKQWDDDFHAKNAEWQQAANAALAKGQTPPTYDEYWQGKSGSTSSSSADASASSSSGSSDQASTPAQQPQPQQQQAQPQQQQAQPQSTSTDNNNDASSSSQDNSNDCSEEDTPASTSTTQAAASSSVNGAAAAAATGSKNQATTNNSNSSSSSSSSSSQSTSGHYDGQATYYAPGLGACGWTNTASDYIVAISASLFDSFGSGNPNNNPACGHKIAATYGGKTITVSVADRCVGCAWGDLDFTPTGFSQLADMSKGRLDGLTWSWIGAAP